MLITCPRCKTKFEDSTSEKRNHGFDQVFHECPNCKLIISSHDTLDEDSAQEENQLDERSEFMKKVRWYASIASAGTVNPIGRRILSKVSYGRNDIRETWLLVKGCNLDGFFRFIFSQVPLGTLVEIPISPYDKMSFQKTDDIEKLTSRLGPFRWLPVSREVYIRRQYMLWQVSFSYDLKG